VIYEDAGYSGIEDLRHITPDAMAKTAAQRQAEYVARKKADSKCATCTNKVAPGAVTCGDCRERNRARYETPKVTLADCRVIIATAKSTGNSEEAGALKYAINKFFMEKKYTKG
jgi:hypothetical protein